MWMTWLLVAIFFLVFEIVSITFFTLWIGIGALLAMCLSFITDNIALQVVVWVISSTLLLIFTKPFVKKCLNLKNIPTNVYTVLGKTAVVTEEINNNLGKGQIKIDSDIWSARSVSNKIIPVGSYVEIEKIDGVKAMVKDPLLLSNK